MHCNICVAVEAFTKKIRMLSRRILRFQLPIYTCLKVHKNGRELLYQKESTHFSSNFLQRRTDAVPAVPRPRTRFEVVENEVGLYPAMRNEPSDLRRMYHANKKIYEPGKSSRKTSKHVFCGFTARFVSAVYLFSFEHIVYLLAGFVEYTNPSKRRKMFESNGLCFANTITRLF